MILVWIWTQCDTSLRGVHSILNHGVKGFPPSLQGCRNNPCVWLCGREGLNGHSSTDLTICLLFCLSYTLMPFVCLVKAMVFPVVMYACESWTIKRAYHWRIDAFELWCWRRLFRVPWTARRSNQSFLKEISPENSLEGLMLKLKLQYFGHLMRITDLLERP